MAVAFSSWNVYLAPFIYFDKIHRDEMLEEDGYEVDYSTKYAKTKKIKMKYNKRDMYDIKQSVQNLIFALNSNSRLGSEPVFSNFTLDFKVMKPMQQQPIIIAGKDHDFFTYGEFQEEANILINVFAELMLNGDGIGKMHAYPVPTFNIGKSMDYEEPMYQKVFEMAAKDGTPYFGNFVNSTLDEDDIKAMCCRLQLDKRELRKKMGGLFGAGEKTGSIGVFTINLPAIGFRNKGKEKMHFFEDLKEKMLIGKKQLIIKKHTIVKEFEKGLYPALKEYLDNFNTMFMTIGFVGAHEMCRNYLDKGIETTEGRDFTIEIVNFMKEQIADFQEETGELFNLEYTPAESAAYRMAKCDRHRYGSQIAQAGINNKYYTNSTHLPVNIEWTYKQVYEHQNGLLDLATGGSVYHNYMKESTTPEMVKHFLKVSFENYKIPYISFSPLFSICEEHGFLKGLQKQCPNCNSKTTFYQRVTGYIREVENFNEGKLEEFKERYQKDLSDIGEKAE